MKTEYLFMAFIIMSIFMLSGVSATHANDSLKMDDNDTGYLDQISADDSTNGQIDLENGDGSLYVDGNVAVSGNGLADSPYKTLKEAVENAHDGDVIYIAPGVYAGCGNVNLAINKNLSFYNSTAGDVIFDGENTNSMFKFTSTSVSINGLTFKNALGFGNIPVSKHPDGVLFFANGLKNATINASFIGNKMPNAGVITSTGDIGSVNINCSFIDNTGGIYGGSLVYAWKSAIRNSNISCHAQGNLIVNNFIKTNGIYDTNITVKLKTNRARYKGGLAVVCDENKNANSNCTLTGIGPLDDNIVVYDGKSTNIKFTKHYYVDSNAGQTGYGWYDAPFKSVIEAFQTADDGDIIYIAPGIYAGRNNTGFDLIKKLTMVRWGEGDVIFDGEGQRTMFVIYATTFNIIDLTFKNGKGVKYYEFGLITFPMGLKNSIIKATFIDNVMSMGGVLNSPKEFNNVDFDCVFIHNQGGSYEGSLINAWGTPIRNSNIRCYATDNIFNANLFAAAGFINVNITGYFANNTPQYQAQAIVRDTGNCSGTGISFTDSVILDKFPSIYSGGSKADISRNWLGNTRDSVDKPLSGAMNGWLFLDIDVPAGAVDNFTTQLKLSSYDAITKTASSYDEKRLFIPFDGFTLESINAALDKGSVNFHENFTYSALGTGKGTIIAKHEQFTLKQDFNNFILDEVYVIADKAYDIRGIGSKDSPYGSLGMAIENIDNGGTIYVGFGNYTGERNFNLTIDKRLNILKTGEGDAVFDANGAGRILDVNVNTLNISGLTFKSGNVLDNGGAIRFNRDVVDSFINVSCIDNTAMISRGGALYFAADIINSTVEGEFSNHVDSVGYGGAIYVNGKVTNSSINGSFIANKVSIGSAIFFNGDVVDSTVGGEFINNTAANYGTVYFRGNVVNSLINATFENNSLLLGDGCAFYVNGKCLNSTIDGLYKGNRVADGSIIYFNNSVENLVLSGIFDSNIGMSGVLIVYKGSVDNVACDAEFINNKLDVVIQYMEGA